MSMEFYQDVAGIVSNTTSQVLQDVPEIVNKLHIVPLPIDTSLSHVLSGLLNVNTSPLLGNFLPSTLSSVLNGGLNLNGLPLFSSLPQNLLNSLPSLPIVGSLPQTLAAITNGGVSLGPLPIVGSLSQIPGVLSNA